jgi:mono/diheme cytochrome c family protein/cytochrome c553
MNKLLKIGLGIFVLLLVLLGGTYTWASVRDSHLLTRTIETHRVDFPIPFPLAPEEVAQLQPGQDSSQVALANAVARGDHLVHSRYACVECHGQSFGGGVMIDDPMIGHLLGPNLTTGQGSRTLDYGPSDWDRAVRHGVAPDGRPTAMPAEDFQLMSDEELSDIISYIRSMPPVDNLVDPVRLGPLGKILLATGNLPLSADVIPIHTAPHATLPPVAEATVEFGMHLAGTCSGCHRADFSGGPIAGGDPSWPPAMNLTPHADGLAGWTFDDFANALRSGNRPDGTPLREPMSLMIPYAQNMSDVEIQALWMFLQQLPPVASPN